MSRKAKGDVAGQKARWRKRCRERRDADKAFGERWRAQRRAQKSGARARRKAAADSAGQWTFDREGGPNLCRTCRGVISDNALFCDNVRCNPAKAAKRRRMHTLG